MRAKRIFSFFLAFLLLILPAGGHAALNSNLVSTRKVHQLETLAKTLRAEKQAVRQIGTAQSVIEYHDGLSYILEYPQLGMETIDARIQKIIEERRNAFDQEYTPVETEGIEPLHRQETDPILFLSYDAYLTDKNQMSLVFFETHETELSEKRNAEIQISTYHFDLSKDKELSGEELMWTDFRKNASRYTQNYFTKTEPYRNGLFGNYATTLAPEAGRFDRFVLTQEGVLFYFDRYDIFPGSYGTVSLLIPYGEMRTKTPPPKPKPIEPEKKPESIQPGIDPKKPMVALTFDDGPNPTHTNAILDTLEKYGAVATFFDLGSLAETYPKVVQREAALGCEVGSHSYDHKKYSALTNEEIAADVKKTSAAFQKALGRDASLFRPPYGSYENRMTTEIPQPVIIWSVDTLDWKSRNANAIVQEVKKAGNLDGKVILMHGIYGSTADATAMLIPYLQKQGYQLVTVSQLMQAKHGETPQPGKLYGYSYFQ